MNAAHRSTLSLCVVRQRPLVADVVITAAEGGGQVVDGDGSSAVVVV